MARNWINKVALQLTNGFTLDSTIQAAQSTSCSPSILLNSPTLWLTKVAPMLRAWQAIQRLLARIGVARRFKAVA